MICVSVVARKAESDLQAYGLVDLVPEACDQMAGGFVLCQMFLRLLGWLLIVACFNGWL